MLILAEVQGGEQTDHFLLIPDEEAALAEPVVVSTPGYSYEEPANPLPVRPVVTTTTPPPPPPTTPLALYGAPARTGRRGRNFRRGPRR